MKESECCLSKIESMIVLWMRNTTPELRQAFIDLIEGRLSLTCPTFWKLQAELKQLLDAPITDSQDSLLLISA